MSKQHNVAEYTVNDGLSTVGERRDLRQIRCPRCSQLASTRVNKGGKEVLHCSFCHSEFSSTKM